MFKINWEKTSVSMVEKEVLHKMVSLAFPREVLTSYEVIEGGCSNINIKIHVSTHSNPFILRIYIRDKGASYREQKLGLLLKDIIPIPISHYVGDVDNYRFAIVDYLPGIPLRELLIQNDSSNTIRQLMNDVGIILSKISSFKFIGPGFFDDNLSVVSDSTTNNHLIDFAKECLNSHTVKEVLGAEIITEVEICLTKFRNLLPDSDARNLVHGDFDPANILVTEIDGHFQVSGILDWEFSFSGSVLWDVANMLRYSHKMPCEFKDAFINAITADGVVLPNNWHIIIKLLNLLSLLDCLKRSDAHYKPNQCADILDLIKHILSFFNNVKVNKNIEVVPYDPKWPEVFDQEAKIIQKALGNNCIDVHHVGSTSVPGLCAKPTIDMIAVVQNGQASITLLEEVGFSYKGEWNIPFKYGFTKRGENKVNLHLFEEGHPEIELNLVFRNYLRSHPEARDEYARLKEDLLSHESSFEKQEGHLFSGYNLGKDQFIRNILRNTNFDRLRFLKCTHYTEWEAYHRIRKEQIFDPLLIPYDKNHPSMTSDNHFHFILSKGTKVVSVAQIEFLNEDDVALRSLATDEAEKNKGYRRAMMLCLEKWIKKQGKKVIKMHARLDA